MCVYYVCACVWIIRRSIVCTHIRACASVYFGPCPDDDRPGEFYIIMLRAIAVVEGVVNTATRIYVCVCVGIIIIYGIVYFFPRFYKEKPSLPTIACILYRTYTGRSPRHYIIYLIHRKHLQKPISNRRVVRTTLIC